MLVFAATAAAQVNAPSAEAAPQSSSHALLDRPAKDRFAVMAGLMATDGITTQHGIHNGLKEANPLARPFVTHGAVGQLAASGLGYAFGVGGSYLFRRTNHHKMERIFQYAVIGVEIQSTVHNLCLHP